MRIWLAPVLLSPAVADAAPGGVRVAILADHGLFPAAPPGRVTTPAPAGAAA
ncbi:hypothetical protein PE067_12275 [Paracoccus sp. DMF-8]|uniref:hypothetical protein n=1 Tax=Paracoccus sp. DMF-8 TaxID=3019445 RepID=UPI0023E7EBF4|nr:hypothetical protein [Paracoccus sp. DMF-8]MDF3606835.1 hypothetical protein [Paracoccus sp. DMF-8]